MEMQKGWKIRKGEGMEKERGQKRRGDGKVEVIEKKNGWKSRRDRKQRWKDNGKVLKEKKLQKWGKLVLEKQTIKRWDIKKKN